MTGPVVGALIAYLTASGQQVVVKWPRPRGFHALHPTIVRAGEIGNKPKAMFAFVFAALINQTSFTPKNSGN